MTDQASNFVEVHDFDVLADELPGDVYDMDDFKKQIGNNRFDVLIHMYQESFNKNYAKNNQEECDEIVRKIVDVTCHKASPSLHNQGRFLVKPLFSANQWRELNDEECKQFVRQMLRAPTIEDEPDDLGDGEEEDVFAPLPVTSKIDLGSMAIPSSAFGNLELNDTKKRGRRQSLLRRSASESTMLLDKKKGLKNLAGELYRGNSPPPPPNAALRRYHSEDIPDTEPLPLNGANSSGLHHFKFVSDVPPQRSLSDTDAMAHQSEQNKMSSMAGTIAHMIEGMDVVLNGDRKSFSKKPDIVGNNRLRVMLTLEERTYSTLSQVEQTDAACNLVKAITEYWGGRVLVDKEFAYEILTLDDSIEAMKSLLSSSSSSLVSPQKAGAPASLKTSPIPPTLVSSVSSSSASILAAAPPVPEFLRNASREILSSGNGSKLAGPEQMQSAAVRSIKERADKRQMAKEAKGSTSRPASNSKGAASSSEFSVAGESVASTASTSTDTDALSKEFKQNEGSSKVEKGDATAKKEEGVSATKSEAS
ncbi:MAG: hypothetical protein SGILL_010536, partial [Bacillariaceae sp.]